MSDLDTFESELLAELRSVVARRATSPTPLPVARRHRRRLVAAAATVAAALTGALVLPGVVGSPAYAVQDGPDDTIKVSVSRLEDAAGLQHALEEHGVAADVQYLPPDHGCAPGRYKDAISTPDSVTRFGVGTDEISVELDRRDVPPGRTVVISASRIAHGFNASVGIAQGEVQPCRPVPLPDHP